MNFSCRSCQSWHYVWPYFLSLNCPGRSCQSLRYLCRICAQNWLVHKIPALRDENIQAFISYHYKRSHVQVFSFSVGVNWIDSDSQEYASRVYAWRHLLYNACFQIYLKLDFEYSEKWEARAKPSNCDLMTGFYLPPSYYLPCGICRPVPTVKTDHTTEWK